MNFDHQIVVYLNQLAVSSSFMKTMTIFFAQYFPYLVAAAFLVWVVVRLISRKEKIILFIEGFGAAIVTRFGFVELCRVFVPRLRPYVSDPAIAALISETSRSFPSGHAAFFFALSTVIYLRNKRLGIWFYVASAVIGVARVAAGVHYPTDILGGAVLGIAVGLATHQLVKRYRNPFGSGEEMKKTV